MNRTTRRIAALGAVLCAVAALVVAIAVLWNNWAPLLGAIVLVGVALVAAWYVVAAHGVIRLIAMIVAVAAIAIAFVTLLRNHSIGDLVLLAVLVVAFGVLARVTLRNDPSTIANEPSRGTSVGAAQRPILIMNPWSGGGKANEAFAAAAHERGIETVMLQRGDDLEQLARDALGARRRRHRHGRG